VNLQWCLYDVFLWAYICTRMLKCQFIFTAVCGFRRYNPFFNTCCRGVLNFPGGRSCCGTRAYNPHYRSCCNGRLAYWLIMFFYEWNIILKAQFNQIDESIYYNTWLIHLLYLVGSTTLGWQITYGWYLQNVRFSDVKIIDNAHLSNKNVDINLVRTTRFWNNLHQERSKIGKPNNLVLGAK
jgi:hypothetical protein